MRYGLLAVIFALALLAIERWTGSHFHIGFFAWFGFVSCAVLVGISLLLGRFIKRRDDYYDD